MQVKEGRIWQYHLVEEGSETALCGEKDLKYTYLDLSYWEDRYHSEYQLSYCEECEQNRDE